MKKLFVTMLTVVCVIVIACSRTGAGDLEDLNAIDQSDDVFPVINTTRPTANQVYISGDSIIVEGKVTDNKKLYKGKVLIRNDANSSTVAENYYETHFLSVMNFRLAYKTYVTATTDYTVLLEFQDHGLNTTTASIKVKVNP